MRRQYLDKLFKASLINSIETVYDWAVQIQDSPYFLSGKNGHYDLRTGIRITDDMPFELMHIGTTIVRLLPQRSAYAFANGNPNTGRLTVKGPNTSSPPFKGKTRPS